MKLKLRRRFFYWLEVVIDRMSHWQSWHDLCEVCSGEAKNTADQICVGCEARICIECNSGYYVDETLCKVCETQITPEERARDRQDFLVDQCENFLHKSGCYSIEPHTEHGEHCRCRCDQLEGDDMIPTGYHYSESDIRVARD